MFIDHSVIEINKVNLLDPYYTQEDEVGIFLRSTDENIIYFYDWVPQNKKWENSSNDSSPSKDSFFPIENIEKELEAGLQNIKQFIKEESIRDIIE